MLVILAPSDLFHRYPGEPLPQPCYIQLDCETAILRAEYDPLLDRRTPAAVAQARVLRWAIPILTTEAATTLLQELGPLASRVCRGYATVFDGRLHRGQRDDDADAAATEIATRCARLWSAPTDGRRVEWVCARAWLALLGDAPAQRAHLRVDATTDDATVAEIAAWIVAEGNARGVRVDDAVRAVRRLRDGARA